jgi:hypothetical protein
LRSPDIKNYNTYFMWNEPNAIAGINKMIALAKADHADVLCLVHQDTYLPAGWYETRVDVMLQTLPADWAVCGPYGVSDKDMHIGYACDTRFGEILKWLPKGISNIHSLDEYCLILNVEKAHKYEDLGLEWDLYGTQICLDAKERGMGTYLCPAFAVHHPLRHPQWKPDKVFLDKIELLKKRYPSMKVTSVGVTDPDWSLRECSGIPTRPGGWCYNIHDSFRVGEEIFIMPYPRAGETKENYLDRCIPYMIDKEGKKENQAVAMCYAFWEEYGQGKKESVYSKAGRYLNESHKKTDITEYLK